MAESQWYVKWEATNEISGPMTKAEALAHTGDGSGMAFSEGVFEPYRLPADVTDLVNKLMEINRDYQIREETLELLKQATNMLILLSRPREVAAYIIEDVFNVEKIDQGVTLEVRDYDFVPHPRHHKDDRGHYRLMEFGGNS